MRKILLLAVLSLTLVACEQQDKHMNVQTTGQDSDNTGINVRDRDSSAITPMNQSENEADRAITKKIRQAIMADKSLSTNAKNIKIITISGVVTLRGPVSSAIEKENIARKITNVEGVLRVDNQLEVTRSNS